MSDFFICNPFFCLIWSNNTTDQWDQKTEVTVPSIHVIEDCKFVKTTNFTAKRTFITIFTTSSPFGFYI